MKLTIKFLRLIEELLKNNLIKSVIDRYVVKLMINFTHISFKS